MRKDYVNIGPDQNIVPSQKDEVQCDKELPISRMVTIAQRKVLLYIPMLKYTHFDVCKLEKASTQLSIDQKNKKSLCI